MKKTLVIFIIITAISLCSCKKENSKEKATDSQNSFADETVLMTVVETETEEPTENTDSWKEIYLDYLSTQDLNVYVKGDLVLLNDDEIPELFLESGSYMPGVKVCWINNGEINVFDQISYSQGISYTEKTGLFSSGAIRNGVSTVSVYSFDGSTIDCISTVQGTVSAKSEEAVNGGYSFDCFLNRPSSDLINRINNY